VRLYLDDRPELFLILPVNQNNEDIKCRLCKTSISASAHFPVFLAEV
jgi:hypothetical protein